jgi:hypothetical protein
LEAPVHICPHCQKLGISTYAAIADPFSRGLATCRYCHNVSKRVRRHGFNVVGPIMVVAFWALIHFFNPPVPAALFWFAFLAFGAFVIADRLTDFEKKEESNGNPNDLTNAASIVREQ